VLPLAALVTIRDRGIVYGLAAVDSRGRVADHHVMAALGWAAGTRLDIRERSGLILVRANRQGVFSMTSQGHLRLPATVRQWCRLAPGDRVMLTADPADGLLVVHPPATLDVMIMQFHASVLGGEAA
jgi:bifunctional DNA-binding transcriptional regulator/antitoxin component of YhaV-PrlF toxin-antitoxin module